MIFANMNYFVPVVNYSSFTISAAPIAMQDGEVRKWFMVVQIIGSDDQMCRL